MRAWPVQDAKARFSAFLETCLKDGSQIVTKRGAEAAVLVPVETWRRLQKSARPTLKDLLLAMTHNLIVVTRNVRDFDYFSVATLNPFELASGDRR